MRLPDDVLAILRRLSENGYQAYVVGGCVRDAVMGVPCQDYDITTDALPAQTRAAFSDVRVLRTGERHGTVTVLWNQKSYEVTTFRTEGAYRDHRHPDEVRFVRTLREDLSRRDFTVNAMAFSPETGIVDYFGGQEDIRRKVIRCVGNPAERLQDDALRILRGYRFASRLEFSIEEKTRAAIREKKELMRYLSVERIRGEFLGMLNGKDPEKYLEEDEDVFRVILPEWDAGHLEREIHALEKDGELRLAAFLSPLEYAGAEKIVRRWKFSRPSERRILCAVRLAQEGVPSGMKEMRMLLREYEPSHVEDALKIRGLHQDVEKERKTLEEIRERKLPCRIGDLAVDGRDAKALGYQGKEIGNALERALDAVIEGEAGNSREELLRYLRK